MSAIVEMPTELKPCESCGHEPDPARRYAWLAGCPDGHVFHVWNDLDWLATKLVHEWPDRTYSALRLDEWKGSADLVLAWLDACHEGRTTRLPALTDEMVRFSTVLRHEHRDETTGDITVTYSFPPIERG